MAFPFRAWTLPTFVPLPRLHTDDVENSTEHGRMLLPGIVTDCGILVFVKVAQCEARSCVLRRATHLRTSVKLRVMKAVGQGLSTGKTVVGAARFYQMFSFSQLLVRWLGYWTLLRSISFMYKDSVSTSHRTQYASLRKTIGECYRRG
jgi:hypothetical protein